MYKYVHQSHNTFIHTPCKKVVIDFLPTQLNDAASVRQLIGYHGRVKGLFSDLIVPLWPWQ